MNRVEWSPANPCPKCGWGIRDGKCVRGCSMNQFCDCTKDGWCERFQREMIGRFREICQGINCDPGEAAEFRDQWLRETRANSGHAVSRPQDSVSGHSPMKLILVSNQCPGDAVAMTAAIYSLHVKYPDRYLTAVESPYPEVFRYNPHVVEHYATGIYPPYTKSELLPVQMHYPAIHDSNKRGIHFMQAWCEHLGASLGIDLPLMTNRPHLYFDHWEEPDTGDFWIVCSGGKQDLTNKLWGHENYQQVVDTLKHRIRFVQVGANIKDHPPIQGFVQYMVGKTNLRQLFDWVRRSRGVLCGVSLLMHVAAALEKPCVVIAGGREPVQWNAYPNQQYLHTVGALPCRDTSGSSGACWRSRVVPLGDNAILDKDTCLYPEQRNHIIARYRYVATCSDITVTLTRNTVTDCTDYSAPIILLHKALVKAFSRYIPQPFSDIRRYQHC